MQRRGFLGLLAGLGACAACPTMAAADQTQTKGGPKGGMVTFSFDDGLTTQHKYALPVLKSRGLTATAGIIASRMLSGNEDYMSVDQVRDMEKAGWEIASHSLTHTRPINIPKYYSQEPVTGWTSDPSEPQLIQTQYDYDIIAGLYQDDKPLVEMESEAALINKPGTYYYDRSIAELHVHPFRAGNPEDLNIRAGSYQRELEVSRQILTDLGFKISTYVAPYNYWPDDMKETSKYYYSQAATGKDADNRPDSFDRYAIKRFMVHEKDSAASLIRIIRENAQGFGGWVIFCMHGVEENVGWEPYSAEKLGAVANWVLQENIPVVTIAQGTQSMSQMTPKPSAGKTGPQKG